jgi:hypothetical protein
LHHSLRIRAPKDAATGAIFRKVIRGILPIS